MNRGASSLRRGYFLAVAGFALLVAVPGLFWPQVLPQALPFQLPPLHARFVGALYAGGALCMLLASASASASAVRSTLDLTGLWTGSLLAITALRWDDFDHVHKGLWAWLGAYVVFPLGAAWLRHTEAVAKVPLALHMRHEPVLWMLRIQGLLLLVLAGVLFIWPTSAGLLWPWKISAFLAQVYAGPLFAMASASLLLALRRNWAEVRIPCTGIAAFAALALGASALHASLFDLTRPATTGWVSALLAITVLNARLAAMAARHGSGVAAPLLARPGAPA